MKVGLYFGSFNPPHRGHLAIAQAAITHAQLDEVWFVVSPQNPFKTQDALAPETMRLEMVKLICAPYANFKACDIEFALSKPSYTCETLRQLSDQYPHTFALIIGEDNWRVFDQWREHDWILNHYPVLVYCRRNADVDAPLTSPHPNVSFLPGDYLDVSATEVRALVHSQESIDHLVEPAVAKYITDRGLYR